MLQRDKQLTNGTYMTERTAALTTREMSESELKHAQRVAEQLGFSETAYTTMSDLIGLFCLASRPGQTTGCLVQTDELGLLFVSDETDLGLDE